MPASEEEQDLRLAIELSLRDARASQNLGDQAPPADPIHGLYNEQYSSVVTRVPNKSVEELNIAPSNSDSSHMHPHANSLTKNQAFVTLNDVRLNNLLTSEDDKVCDYEHIIFPGRRDQPSRFELFEPDAEDQSSVSSSAYCSGLSEMSSLHPLPHTRSDSGTWTADEHNAGTNKYEHYFFGTVDDCSQVTDDDPGPQLDAVLRTLSKLTIRLEDNGEGGDRDDLEDDDSFLENLLQNDHQSGVPPLAAGEDDSNETTSPAGGSLASPELEHDTPTEQAQWSYTSRPGNQTETDTEEQPVFV